MTGKSEAFSMSSLLTKYRPQTWGDVIGQDPIVKSLRKAIEGRAPAYLYTGPPGTGKTTLARLTAKALGSPLELIEVDAASKTGIEDMRNVTADLMFRPLGGGIKGVIIDEAQGLSKSAWQSLLKILEEPPPHVFWFLCTTEPDKVPKAVLTRTLAYELRPVSEDALFELLANLPEAKSIETSVIELCCEQADGSPRQALANLSKCLSAKDHKEAAYLLRTVVDESQAIDLARLLMKGARWPEVQGLLSKLADVSPETVRHVIRAYFTKVLINTRSENEAERVMAVLEEFSKPFHSSDGVTPLLLACGRLTLGM